MREEDTVVDYDAPPEELKGDTISAEPKVSVPMPPSQEALTDVAASSSPPAAAAVYASSQQ